MDRFHFNLLPLLLVPGTLLVGARELAAEVTERFEKTVPFASRGSFLLDNVNGSVVIEVWDQPSLRIEAEKKASDEDRLREIEIEVIGEGDRVEVRTRYPQRRRGGKRSVSYFIRLPRDARVDAETVNGKLSATGVEGGLRVSTVNGSVHLKDVGGEVEAGTVNGSIEAALTAPGDGRHRFSTTNGSVTLSIPAGASGELDAETVNGSVTTDFPLTLSGSFSRKRLRAQIGDGGGASFEIRTVNGSITLRRT
jgi:hypothetical protein